MNRSTPAALLLSVIVTAVLCGCDKPSTTGGSAKRSDGTERALTNREATNARLPKPAETSTFIEPEPAATMKLSFPLERLSIPPAKADERQK